MDIGVPVREEPDIATKVTSALHAFDPFLVLNIQTSSPPHTHTSSPRTHHSSPHTSFTSKDQSTHTPSTSKTISNLVRLRNKTNGDTKVEVNSSTDMVPEVNQPMVGQGTFLELLV